MKTLLFGLMLAIGTSCFSMSAMAQDTFKLTVSLSAKQMPEEARLKDQCYQLARQVEVVRIERKDPKWFEAMPGTEYVWRITKLSSGLICKELVEGTNNLQFGSSVTLEGCKCKGELEAFK